MSFPAVYTVSEVSADDDVNFVMLATLKSQQKWTPKWHAALCFGLQKQGKRLAAADANIPGT